MEAIERDELTGIYPEIEADVRALKAEVDDGAKRVSVTWRDDMPPRVAEWSGREGCVTLPIGAQPRSASLPTESRPAIDSQPWPMGDKDATRSEAHTSELPSLMRISYAVLC